MPSTSRAALAQAAGSGVVRQLRTNRNTVVRPVQSDDEDDSDNEPLANNQQSEWDESLTRNLLTN